MLLEFLMQEEVLALKTAQWEKERVIFCNRSCKTSVSSWAILKSECPSIPLSDFDWAWLGIRAADGLCEYQGKGMLEKQCEDTELEKKKRGCCVSKVMCLNSTVWKARIAKVMATLAWVSGMWNCHLSNLYYTWSLSNQCYQSHLPTQTPAVWQLGKKWALKCSLREFPCTWHRWELSYI